MIDSAPTATAVAGPGAAPDPAWWALPPARVVELLAGDVVQGLTPEEAARRRARHGPNTLPEPARRSPVAMLLAQFTDVMVLVLLAAAVIAGALGEPADVAAILVIVVLNAALGFAQEYRAEQAMLALRALAAPSARVRRHGEVAVLPAAELVPGDVVLLEAGNVVPADVRLVETVRLRTDEASLTGESVPVDKHVPALDGDDVPLADRRNMAFKGTTVSHGHGLGLVTATGVRTELGRIAALLQETGERKTPLQRRLATFGQRLALAVVALCAVMFVIGLLRGEAPLPMLMTALSLAVAAVPEALPAVVTVALALGARRMVKRHALVRRLAAVETLGSVTVVCSDKTGTLTQNRMRVESYAVDGAMHDRPPADAIVQDPWPVLLEALALNNDAVPGTDGEPSGDPMELALHRAAAEAGFVKSTLAETIVPIDELPFSAERARMTTFHRRGDDVIAYTKGAPERILPACADRLGRDGFGPLDVAAELATAERMAAWGLRVLAVAVRHLDALPDELTDAEEGQTFLGLVGLMDPPRDEARAAVGECQRAGIRVVMITGDHPETARTIATQLGIATAAEEVVTGRTLAGADDRALAALAGSARVFARVTPEDKIRIVAALQSRGELVAMTGDGVNDAPSLRRADIGVAMGRGGTDVAREAAHLVLLDDDFATIVRAVREGRRIYDNIRKFVRYVLTGNAGEIWALFMAPFLGLPIPLLPIHILWVNLVTDGLPGIALASEPAEGDVMRRPPRPPAESVWARGLWQHAVWVGLLIGGITLATQAWALRTGSANWRSMAFTVLTLAQMGHVLAIRSERDPMWRHGLLSNPALLGAVLLTFGLQLAALYLPSLSRVLRTTPLTASELAFCIAVSALVPLAVEVEKALVRRGMLYRA